MKAPLFALLLAGLLTTAAPAVPVSPAVEKFHKDGIKVSVGAPAIVQGEIGNKEPTGPHLVQMLKGQAYQLDLAAPFTGTLRIEEHPGGALLFSSGSAKGEFVAPKDGLYRVIVVAPTAGKYSLTIAQKAPLLFRDPPGVRVVAKDGLTITDALAPGDAVDKVRRAFCKTYDVRLTAGKNYQVDMMSGQFDTYLRVEDSAGKQIAFNDDGGEGLNSRLPLRVADGVYRIICTSFSAGAQGQYTLTIREK
jgi:hypothetical protein